MQLYRINNIEKTFVSTDSKLLDRSFEQRKRKPNEGSPVPTVFHKNGEYFNNFLIERFINIS